MKKFYIFLCAAALGLTATARELTFYYGDKVIAPGETVYFNDLKVEDYGNFKEVAYEPQLFITTDIFTNKLIVVAECTTGQQIQMCAGGLCSMGEKVEKKDITVSPNTKLPLQFDCYLELEADETAPTISTTFTAQDGTYAETLKSFVLVMGENASVTLIEIDNQLKYTAAGLEYNISAPTAFALYTIDGRKVLSAELQGTGTLSTSGLQAGIYVYSLGNKTAKIFIQ